MSTVICKHFEFNMHSCRVSCLGTIFTVFNGFIMICGRPECKITFSATEMPASESGKYVDVVHGNHAMINY